MMPDKKQMSSINMASKEIIGRSALRKRGDKVYTGPYYHLILYSLVVS